MENALWRNSKRVSKFIAMAIACLAAVWVAVPFLWAIDNSLKTNADIFRPGAVIPFLQFTPRLDMWKTVLDDPQVLNCLFSSALVALSTSGKKAGEKLAEIMAIIGSLAARTNCTQRCRDSADISRWQGVSYLR